MKVQSFVYDMGAAFISGYAVGGAFGAIKGMADNLNELPLVQINQTLNTASDFGGKCAYTSAFSAFVFDFTKVAANSAWPQKPILSYSLAGGAAGAFCASSCGKSKAVGGIAGATLGALYGFHLSQKATLDDLI